MVAVEWTGNLPGLEDLGKDKPKGIFIRGHWPVKNIGQVAAVVGSRRMTGYGERVVGKLTADLVSRGLVVLSGLMYGVDKTAHRAGLGFGGKTAAVLGWGINEPMRPDDEKLAGRMIEAGGAVISEWDRQAGALWTFPRRDRIMAALAGQIYVVEAAEKSGALITAEWGIKLKREIWAVPGPVTSLVSAGTNQLIAEGKARMWTEATNITDEYKSNSNATVLYTLLQNEMLSLDELCRKSGKSTAEVSAEISMLVLSGRVEEKNGKFFAR